MAEPEDLTQVSPLQRGQLALAQGAWADARDHFAAALAVAETPEALEGLSWTAWWLNDATTLFQMRERALQQYRARHDLQGAARMAIWLSSDYVDFRGEAAVANGWRQRARRLLGGLALTPEHGWLALLEGDAALLLEDDTAAARRAGQEATGVGRRLGITDLQMLGRALEGIALVSEGRIEEGMDRLDEAAAAALAGEVEESFSVAWAMCYLIYACERVRDYDRAAQWCEEMRAFAQRVQTRFARGVCRAHYGGILIWRGKWGEAEAELSGATEDLLASRPPLAAEGLVRLAELRRRQGRLDVAADLLGQVEWHPLASLSLAEIALDQGNATHAVELLERLLRHLPRENKTQRIAALELLVRAQATRGDGDQASEALAGLQSISRTLNTLPVRGATSFCAGIVASARRDDEEARRHFEDAVVLFERAGAPYEAARARIELARVLARIGRQVDARRQASAAQHSLSGLGAAREADRAAAVLQRDVAPDQAEPHTRGIPGNLTRRELDVLRLVADGRADREIAARLALSEHTVHRHIANILSKLGVSSRAAAVARAAHDGSV